MQEYWKPAVALTKYLSKFITLEKSPKALNIISYEIQKSEFCH